VITEFIMEKLDIIGRYDIPIVYQLLSLIIMVPLVCVGFVLDIILMPIELIYIKWVNKE